jgi:hypothetical protein
MTFLSIPIKSMFVARVKPNNITWKNLAARRLPVALLLATKVSECRANLRVRGAEQTLIIGAIHGQRN